MTSCRFNGRDQIRERAGIRVKKPKSCCNHSLLQLVHRSLQLLNLLFLPATILVALLPDRLPVLLQGLVRVRMLFFKRKMVCLVLRQVHLQVGYLLFRRVARDGLGRQIR